MTPSLYNQMIVHWWRNKNGTVVYDFSYLRDTTPRHGGSEQQSAAWHFDGSSRALLGRYNY
jgi:hypothetical protein